MELSYIVERSLHAESNVRRIVFSQLLDVKISWYFDL